MVSEMSGTSDPTNGQGGTDDMPRSKKDAKQVKGQAKQPKGQPKGKRIRPERTSERATLHEDLPYSDKEYALLTPAQRRAHLTPAQRTIYEDRAAWRRVAVFLQRCRDRATQPLLKDISRAIRDEQGYSFAVGTLSEWHNPALLPDLAPYRLFALLRHYGVSLADLERVMNDRPLPEKTIHTEVEQPLMTLFRQLSPESAAVLAAEAGILAHREGLPLPAPIARLLPPRPTVAYLPGTVGIADMPDYAVDDAIDEEAQLQQVEAQLDADADAIVREITQEAREQQRRQHHNTTDGSGA